MASTPNQTQYIECPFCQGLLEPKTGKQKCPECGEQLEIDDGLECIKYYLQRLEEHHADTSAFMDKYLEKE